MGEFAAEETSTTLNLTETRTAYSDASWIQIGMKLGSTTCTYEILFVRLENIGSNLVTVERLFRLPTGLTQ